MSSSMDSAGDMVTSSGVSEIPGSPSSVSKQYRSPSPSGDSLGSSVIAPQNPFDAIVDMPSIPSLVQSGSGTDTSIQQQLQLSSSSNIIASVVGSEHSSQQSASPDRSSVGPPHSPLPSRSPAFHPTQTQHSTNMTSSDTSISSGTHLPISVALPQQAILPSTLTLSHEQPMAMPIFAQTENRVPASPLARHSTDPSTSVFLASAHHQTNFDDDENTQPSSAANTADHGHPLEVRQDQSQLSVSENVAGSVMRFLQDAKRRMGSKQDRRDSDGEDLHEGALICGYLQKYGRNGKWQTRWFETDGECLSYYKSSKRSKLLATLDLEKVGTIEVDPDDNRECSFTIQVLGRMYHLRAESRTACKDWVITLNRVKEARLQQGNVKLVISGFNRNTDLLDHADEGVTPRVVVVANRQRTRAVDEPDQFDQIYKTPEDPADPVYMEQKRLSTLGTAVVARWSKRHSTMQRLGTRLSQWARSVKKYGCQDVDADSVVLDRHVHPPGHDDKKRLSTDKAVSGKFVEPVGPSHRAIHHSPANATHKPGKPSRSLSTSSEDIRTIS